MKLKSNPIQQSIETYLIHFTFLILFSTRGGMYLYSFAIINLLTALSNLLPARGYDGYRIMYSTLALLSNAERSARFMHAISLFFSAFVVFLSLGLIMIFDSGYWIFVIFFISLIGELTKRQKHINRENNWAFGSIREYLRVFPKKFAG